MNISMRKTQLQGQGTVNGSARVFLDVLRTTRSACGSPGILRDKSVGHVRGSARTSVYRTVSQAYHDLNRATNTRVKWNAYIAHRSKENRVNSPQRHRSCKRHVTCLYSYAYPYRCMNPEILFVRSLELPGKCETPPQCFLNAFDVCMIPGNLIQPLSRRCSSTPSTYN